LRNLSKCGKGWLTGVASCTSLIKPSTARVGTGLKSRRCLKVGCGGRLRSTDSEPIHYSAGVNLRVMGGRREQIIDPPRDSPLMYKGTCAEEKASKKCSAQFGRNCTAWDWEKEVRPLVLRKKLDDQPLLLRVFLMQDPDCWSAIPVRTQRVVQLLTGTWQSHVSL
jgi:hypothetical protein